MFKQDKYIKTEYTKTKDYNYLDGLYFLCIFSTFYEDTPFELDENTKEILSEITNLTKIEYENESLNKVSNYDFKAIFEIIQSQTEDYECKIDKMSKEELKALQKQSYVLSKKIFKHISKPFDIEDNKFSQEIADLSFYILCAESKKEQDALFKKQDALFKKEDEEAARIEKSIENHINKIATLSTCFSESQYTYHAPVKTKAQKIRDYFDSHNIEAKQEKQRDL